MLVTLNDILPIAKKNKYAVGLFNTVNLEMAKGVIAAAEEAKSPVIIGTAEVLLPYAELEELAYFLIPMAKKAKVPVVVHYDHGLTQKRVEQAIALGFSSVMYDCSTLSYEKNCDAVRSMAEYAHSKGVSIEGELGHVGANESDSDSSINASYTDPNEAFDFISRTKADALAVAIGTAHGAYKAKPQLQFDLLSKIAQTIETPLVLHGGSGLSDDDFKKAIEKGISKVNIFTDINCAAARAAAVNYKESSGMTDLMLPIIEQIKLATLQKIRIFGSQNKA